MSDAVLDAARRYAERGWSVVPIVRDQKNPVDEDYTSLRIAPEDVEKWFDGGEKKWSVGVILGEASGRLVDVDLDHPLAVEMAPTFLPPTGMITGRTGKERSHWFYVADELGRQPPYKLPARDDAEKATGNSEVLVEVRHNNLQTLLPPSTYPGGGHYLFNEDGDPDGISWTQLTRACALLASAATLAHHWPEKGGRNELAIAIAGCFAHAGVPSEATELVLRTAAERAGDSEVEKRVRVVATTYDKYNADENVTGWPSLPDAMDPAIGKSVAGALRRWITKAFKGEGKSRRSLDYTDYQLAQEAYAERRGHVVYVPEWREWLEFKDVTWKGFEDAPARRTVTMLAQSYRNRAAVTPNRDAREELEDVAKALEMSGRVSAVVTAMKTIEEAAVSPDVFDSDPMMLATPTGAIDLETGQRFEANPWDYFRRQTSVDPLPIPTPHFDQFMERVCSEHPDLLEFLWRAFAYSITGLVSERSAYILAGSGMNGKSLLLKCIAEPLGTYAAPVSTATFMGQDQDGPMPGLAKLRGSRFAYTTESNELQRFNVGLIKRITGGDVISVRQLYEQEQEFAPTFKIWLATNDQPDVSAADDAMWDRLKLIPMDYMFPKTKAEADLRNIEFVRDYVFMQRYIPEAPGVLHRLVELVPDVLKHGVGIPPSVAQATREYREDVDTVETFVAEELRKTGDENDLLPVSEVFAAYAQWCESIRKRPLNVVHFGRRMKAKGIEPVKVKGSRSYQGLAFVQQHGSTGDLTVDRWRD